MRVLAMLLLVGLLVGCSGRGPAAATPTTTTAPPTATSVTPTAMAVPPSATPIPPTPTAVPPTATTALPTATPVPATPTAAPAAPPAPAVKEIQSGGLGRLRSSWEQEHGRPSGNSPIFLYANSTLQVMYLDDRPINITRVFGDRTPQPLEVARVAGRRLAPTDGVLVRSYTSADRLVEQYRSSSLATVFPAEQFRNGEPGDFMIIYRPTANRITSIIVAVGNNP